MHSIRATRLVVTGAICRPVQLCTRMHSIRATQISLVAISAICHPQQLLSSANNDNDAVAKAIDSPVRNLGQTAGSGPRPKPRYMQSPASACVGIGDPHGPLSGSTCRPTALSPSDFNCITPNCVCTGRTSSRGRSRATNPVTKEVGICTSTRADIRIVAYFVYDSIGRGRKTCSRTCMIRVAKEICVEKSITPTRPLTATDLSQLRPSHAHARHVGCEHDDGGLGVLAGHEADGADCLEAILASVLGVN